MSDLTLYHVDTIEDVYGEPVEISVIADEDENGDGFGDDQEMAAVHVDTSGGSLILDKAGREAFMRAWAEAERRIESGTYKDSDTDD